MRVLMLNYEFPPLGGGAGNATHYILREFSRQKGLSIDLVTSSVGSGRIEKFSDNINIYFQGIGKKGSLSYQSNRDLINYSVRSYFFCKQLIKKEKYDIVHVFFGIPCGFIAMMLGIPYIVSLRGSDVPFYNKRFEILDRLIFSGLSRRVWNKAGFVVANSIGLKELAVKNRFDKHIETIFNGVDADEFIPEFSENRKDKIRLISTGRLIKRKGYEYLIEALKGETSFELYLIGDGNLRSELENTAREQNVPVSFFGYKDHGDIAEYLRKSDIFVLPSLNEGMSNSILEAMACGLPIITTDTGGSRELIKGNGIVVKKDSPEQIKMALKQYEKNRSLLQEHGRISRDLAKKMSWSQVAEKYLDLYKNIQHEGNV